MSDIVERLRWKDSARTVKGLPTEAAAEIERLREQVASLQASAGRDMSDTQSTIAGLKAQDCPGGGWTGMPAELEGRVTVADCLAHGVCGCIYGDAVQHIEQLTAAAAFLDGLVIYLTDGEADAITDTAKAADCRAMAAKLRGKT